MDRGSFFGEDRAFDIQRMKEITWKYKNYLLAVLMVILAFDYLDRFALGLVLQNIKTDLNLSDAQLGFLTGFAFALLYSIMGIPVARWADRGNRVTIIAVTAAAWSIMVALCGTATSFVQMMLIRVGVGIGEAGCIPPAHSLIADYFTREERPRAIAMYWQGTNVSFVLGYFVAGWLSEFYGWRNMFILVGVPGIGLAALAWLTLREPRCLRRTVDAVGGLTAPSHFNPGSIALPQVQPSMRDVLKTLWVRATFRHLLLFNSVFALFNLGIQTWQPAFMMRSFGLKTGELGTWFAVVYGIPAIVGNFCGGEWACRFAPQDESRQLKVMAIINAGFNGVIWSLVYFCRDYYTAFALMALSSFGGALITGPVYATIQTLVPAPMRAMSFAILFLFANLIGMGLGPLAVGVLSDGLKPFFGEESLRYALLALCPGFLWASWHLWRGSKTVTRELALAIGDRDAPTIEGNIVGKVPAKIAVGR